MNTWIYSHLLDGKASAYDAGNLGSVPESGRSSGERNVNPLQYSCLENPMDRGAPSYSPLGRKDSDTTEWLLFCHLKKNSLFLDSDTPIQILSCLFLLKVTFFGKKKKVYFVLTPQFISEEVQWETEFNVIMNNFFGACSGYFQLCIRSPVDGFRLSLLGFGNTHPIPFLRLFSFIQT